MIETKMRGQFKAASDVIHEAPNGIGQVLSFHLPIDHLGHAQTIMRNYYNRIHDGQNPQKVQEDLQSQLNMDRILSDSNEVSIVIAEAVLNNFSVFCLDNNGNPDAQCQSLNKSAIDEANNKIQSTVDQLHADL